MSEEPDAQQPAVSSAPAEHRPAVPKPWRPVAGLADRPSRMAFSDRLFFWFVYLGAFALIAVGVGIIWLVPYRLGWKVGAGAIGLGVGVFAFCGPSGSQEKGYRM